MLVVVASSPSNYLYKDWLICAKQTKRGLITLTQQRKDITPPVASLVVRQKEGHVTLS